MAGSRSEALSPWCSESDDGGSGGGSGTDSGSPLCESSDFSSKLARRPRLVGVLTEAIADRCVVVFAVGCFGLLYSGTGGAISISDSLSPATGSREDRRFSKRLRKSLNTAFSLIDSRAKSCLSGIIITPFSRSSRRDAITPRTLSHERDSAAVMTPPSSSRSRAGP